MGIQEGDLCSLEHTYIVFLDPSFQSIREWGHCIFTTNLDSSTSGVFRSTENCGVAKWMISTFLCLAVVHHQQLDTNLGAYLNHTIF